MLPQIEAQTQTIDLLIAPSLSVQESVLPFVEPVKDNPLDTMSVSELIRHFSDVYHTSSTLPLNVACAESQMVTTAKNPNSSARGVFQFVSDTWKRNCSGDVYSPIDNVSCGVRLISEGGISHWNASKFEGTGGGWYYRPYERGLCAL